MSPACVSALSVQSSGTGVWCYSEVHEKKEKKKEKQSTFQRRYTHMANKHVKILDSYQGSMHQ